MGMLFLTPPLDDVQCMCTDVYAQVFCITAARFPALLGYLKRPEDLDQDILRWRHMSPEHFAAYFGLSGWPHLAMELRGHLHIDDAIHGAGRITQTITPPNPECRERRLDVFVDSVLASCHPELGAPITSPFVVPPPAPLRMTIRYPRALPT